MRCDGFRLSCPLEQEQLWEDGNRLEEDGEGPQNFRDPELVVEEETKDHAGPNEVFDFERIDGGVVGWTRSRESVTIRRRTA